MSSFFSSELHKFKSEIQLKPLNHIVDEKQVAIKDAITIISSLNASHVQRFTDSSFTCDHL